jgi:hypothetical protein
MERHELRELVEDALEAMKPRYQQTRTPLTCKGSVRRSRTSMAPRWPTMKRRKFPASCSGYGSAGGAWNRRRLAASGGGSAIRRRPSRAKYDRSAA